MFYRRITPVLLTLCLTFLSAAAIRAAESSPPPSYPKFSNLISNTFSLNRQHREPAACITDRDGIITMNAQAQVCICDGKTKQWKTVGTGAACAWRAATK